MKELHGHELIHLILEANKPLTLDEIKKLSEETFGKDVSYYACSASDMDIDEMITFLLTRRKLVNRGNGFVIDTGEVCDH